MPIDPTSATASLLAALEAQAARRSTKPERGASGPARGRSGGTGPARAGVPDDLARIAQAFDPDTPGSYERARRQAVSVLLQDQLGGRVRELPEWSALVDRVADAIAAEPAVDARMAAWLCRLKR